MRNLAKLATELSAKVKESVSVVVARKSSEIGLERRKLNLATDAASSFRVLCDDAVQSLQGHSVLAYNADAELTGCEVFVLDDAESLRELTDLRALATQAATLPNTSPKALDLSVQFYAVIVGDAHRAVFIRRVDPQIRYKAGGFLAIAETQLRRLEEPAFSFSPGFDLVLSDEWVIVINQSAFERLFRDIGLVERHVAEWVKGITDNLPMAEASVTALRDVALRDSRTWRKLREIRRRGHLADVDLTEVRRYASKMGLDPKAIVRDGHLVFDPADRFSFLHLLNEDLYKGPLTDKTFEAQRKSPTGT